jgi:ATP synthase protein I
MSDGTPPDPLSRLGERIEELRRQRDKARGPAGADDAPQGALGAAMRIGIELVAALCVGLGLGWVFDHVFGTRPWGLIVFFFVGAAAGMVNVFRAAQRMGR